MTVHSLHLRHALLMALFQCGGANRLQSGKCKEVGWKDVQDASTSQEAHDVTEGYTLQEHVQIFSVRNITTDFPVITREHVLELRPSYARAMKYSKTDGNLHTRSDFMSIYGKGHAKVEWDAAMVAPYEWKDTRFGTGWSFSCQLFDESNPSLGYKWDAQQKFNKGGPASYESISLSMNNGKVHSWRMWEHRSDVGPTSVYDKIRYTINRWRDTWWVYQGKKRDGITLYTASIAGGQDEFKLKIVSLTKPGKELAGVYSHSFISLDEWTDLMRYPDSNYTSETVVKNAPRRTPNLNEQHSGYLVVRAGENGAVLSAVALVSHVAWLREKKKVQYGFDRRLQELEEAKQREKKVLAAQKKQETAKKKEEAQLVRAQNLRKGRAKFREQHEKRNREEQVAKIAERRAKEKQRIEDNRQKALALSTAPSQDQARKEVDFKVKKAFQKGEGSEKKKKPGKKSRKKPEKEKIKVIGGFFVGKDGSPRNTFTPSEFKGGWFGE